MFIPSTFKRPVSSWKAKRASKITCRRSDVMSKGKKRSGARPGRPQPLRGTKGKRKGARLWYVGGNNFNCRGFGPLLEDKLCLIFKLAPSVCRMTFPILASLLVRLVVLLPFQLLRLSLATPSRWTPLALSVFLHCVVGLLLTLLTLPSIKLRKCSSKIITSILSFISGRLATKSNQIKQLIRNGRSASLQRTFKKSFTSFSHSTRNKTRDGLIRVRNIRAL